MGMFSWIDVDNSQNVTDYDDKVILLIPKDETIRDSFIDFFGYEDNEITKQGIEGHYSGYGEVSGLDIYEVVAFLNICACNDEQFQTVYNRICERKSKDIADEMTKLRQAYKEGFFNSPEDFWTLKEEFSLPDRIFDTEFRIYGIDLACYDEDNARLPYPIKLTFDETLTYENTDFSMGDPNQGFNKYKKGEEKQYEYHEYDWESYAEYENSDDRYTYDAYQEFFKCESEKGKILEEIEAERGNKEEEIER